jgi:hypothetical protein
MFVDFFVLKQSAKVRNKAIGQTFFRTFAAKFKNDVYKA